LGDWLCIQGHVENLPLDDVFVCFETRYDDCECRKPKPGMILAAAKKWDIDFSRSYMIGDTASDTGAAKAAGVKSILIRASYNKDVASDYAAWSLREAAFLIKRLEGGEKQ
jgi:D-glycero-D-manno-heptose 1,7-bisphosphate phosphatase